MADTLKCASCNIVIDELLAYLQNKLSVMDEESLKLICVSAFTCSEISKSKSLLFESLPTDMRKTLRKRKGKEVRDLDDIIRVMKSVDPDKTPIFVARELEKLPPILFDHLDCTKLLKDITRLSADIELVKNTYATMKQVEELRSYVHNLKYASLPPSSPPSTPAAYVNMRRGGGTWTIDSGPVGLTLSPITSNQCDYQLAQINTSKNEHITPTKCSEKDVKTCQPLSKMECNELPRVTPASVQLLEITERQAVTINCEREGDVQAIPMQVSPTVVNPSTSTLITCTTVPSQALSDTEITNSHSKQKQHSINITKNEAENGWQEAKNRKKKLSYRYLGERGNAVTLVSSFKAAEKNTPMFITNVHLDTVESDITKYIMEKTHTRVSLERINTKKLTSHKAYKFFVPESKVSQFLDKTIWPEGILFRRFVHYKQRRSDTVTSADGPLLTKK